jgi:hypothetical protein
MFMPSDYPFVIVWPVYRLSYFDLCLLIAPLVSFGHCIVVLRFTASDRDNQKAQIKVGQTIH